MHYLIRLLVLAVAVLLTNKIVPGVRVKSFRSALLFALVLAVLNQLLFNLLAFVTLPMVVLSFGLFLLVIHAFLYWLADKLVSGVEVDGFGAAFLGSLVTTAISWAIQLVVH